MVFSRHRPIGGEFGEIPMVRKVEVDGRLLVRMPKEVKSWIEREAAYNGSSQNSEIIRAIRCRMDAEQRNAG